GQGDPGVCTGGHHASEVWARFKRLRPLLTVHLVLLSQRSPGIGTHLCRQLVLRRFRLYRLRKWYFLTPGKGSEERIRVFSAGPARVLRLLLGTRLADFAADDGLVGRLSWRWHSAGDLPAQLLPVLVSGGTLLVGPPDEFLGLDHKPVEGFLDEGV